MLDRVQTPAEQVLSRGVEGWIAPPSPARARALAAFTASGLPSRKLEYWHYTDLRILLRNVPEEVRMPRVTQLRPTLLESFKRAGLMNGRAFTAEFPSYARLLRPQIEEGDETALPVWGEGDVIAQINAAHVSDGFKIDIEQDACLEIQNIVGGGQAHIHLPMRVADNGRATIILREIGDGAAAFSTTLTSLEIGSGAEVMFVILRQRGEQAAELNQFNARLQAGAKLTLFIINAGAKLLRQEINVDVSGKGADFQLRGINLLNGKSHTDITMDVRHREEGSSSTEILRNVVMGQARGVFQGMIRVHQQAQKTDARMSCNSLILSDEAEFDAKPELEIFADDVACGHGATVVDINHDHLFYLMARGIPEPQARGLLIKAFVNELAEEIEDDNLQQAIKNIIDQWLDDNH